MPTKQPKKDGNLRVLILTARSDHGGGPRHVLDLLRSLRGHRIQFYIGAPLQEPYAKRFMALTKQFLEIPPQSFSLFKLFVFWRLIKRGEIDVIHSHGRGAGIYSRLLGWLTGVRVLHTFHGIHRDPSLKGRLKLLLDQALAFFSFKPIFVSENEKIEALAYRCVRPGEEGIVIENAVDIERFTFREHLALAMPGRESKHDCVIKLGAFLRADLAKGPDRFLRLVKSIGETALNGARLDWSCVGIPLAELAQYGEVAQYLKVVDRMQEPAPWLESLDVFVSTSRNEGLPLGVLEAMAGGCLCLLSDIPAHRGFVIDGAALLFDPEDEATFRSQLHRLQQEIDLREDLLRAEKNLVEQRYSLSRFAERIHEVYRATSAPSARNGRGSS